MKNKYLKMKKTKKTLILATLAVFLLAGCSNDPKTAVSAPTTDATVPNPTKAVKSTADPASATDTATMMALIRTAFKNRDAKLLRSLMAETVTSGYADGSGPCPKGCPSSELIELRFKDKNASGWEDYALALRFGLGNSDGAPGTYLAPSFPQEPDGKEAWVYIYGTKVNVRAQPDIQSKVLTQLNPGWKKYNPKMVDKWLESQAYEKIGWVPVYYQQGKLGYVNEQLTNFAQRGTITVQKAKNGQFHIIDITNDYVCAL